jgi:hypothetical protein
MEAGLPAGGVSEHGNETQRGQGTRITLASCVKTS